jgi:hypothetical protein
MLMVWEQCYNNDLSAGSNQPVECHRDSRHAESCTEFIGYLRIQPAKEGGRSASIRVSEQVH